MTLSQYGSTLPNEIVWQGLYQAKKWLLNYKLTHPTVVPDEEFSYQNDRLSFYMDPEDDRDVKLWSESLDELEAFAGIYVPKSLFLELEQCYMDEWHKILQDS